MPLEITDHNKRKRMEHEDKWLKAWTVIKMVKTLKKPIHQDFSCEIRESYLSRVLLIDWSFVFLCSCSMTYNYLNISLLPGGIICGIICRFLYSWSFRNSMAEINLKCDHSVESLFFSVRQWLFLHSHLAFPET